jgi:hypothetical protein
MGKKLVLRLSVLLLIFLQLAADVAAADIPVGVKKGDWIEYNVATTGNPPPEHDVIWARMEIMNVQAPETTVNVTTEAPNGTLSSLVMTLNLEKGQIGAWWIIPANLNVGGTFYDAFFGINITIQGEEQLEYAGATRTITNTSIPERTKRWDKATGVFVLSSDNYSDYTIDVVAYSTNIWGPQNMGLDSAIVHALFVLAVVLVIVAAIALVVVGRRRRQKSGEITVSVLLPK